MSTPTIGNPAGRSKVEAAAILQSSTLAVVAAFCLRAYLLVLSHHAEDKLQLGLQVIGREAGFIAFSLASGKGFSNPFPGYDLPTGWLAPVFPALWSIGFRIFDPYTTDRGVYFGQLMNCAISAFTCWPLYWLGRRLFSSAVGLAAAWAWVFMPLAILFPLEWVWDQSLSALVLALLLCATYQVRDLPAASPAWSGYGLLWGFAALVNPTLCVLLPFLVAWVAFCRRKSALPMLLPGSKVVLLFLLCILPWTARNYFALDGFVFVKSNFGLELWLGNNPQVPSDDVYATQLHPMNNLKELLPLVFSGEPGYMRAKERAALRFMYEHPRSWLGLEGRRVLDTWTAAYDSRHDKWMAALHLGRAEIWFCTALTGLALAGLVLALLKDARECMPLAFCVVVFPVPYYITHSSLRYRHPIDPVLTLLGVWAIARIISRQADRGCGATPIPEESKVPAPQTPSV
jgi:4-amino-4-deoxy-L-arabinose transferase-like glycosyltransferase